MSELKGFIVTADGCEALIPVLAPTKNKAKSMALCTEWLCDFEYTELLCRREDIMDVFGPDMGAGAWEFDTYAQQNVARDMGWYALEETSEECSICDLHEWPLVPESILDWSDESDPICADVKRRLNNHDTRKSRTM